MFGLRDCTTITTVSSLELQRLGGRLVRYWMTGFAIVMNGA